MYVQDVFPVELDIPNRDSKLLKGYGDGRRAATEGAFCETASGLTILLLSR